MIDDYSVNHHDSAEQQIDNVAGKRYFDSTRGGTAQSAAPLGGFVASTKNNISRCAITFCWRRKVK